MLEIGAFQDRSAQVCPPVCEACLHHSLSPVRVVPPLNSLLKRFICFGKVFQVAESATQLLMTVRKVSLFKWILSSFFPSPCTQKSLFQAPNGANDRRQGFISTLPSKTERRGGGREESERQNKNLISPCFLRVDWEREGFIAARPPLLQLTAYRCSCSPSCCTPSPGAPVCLCVFIFRGCDGSWI